nr:hypothetical protein Ade03nite_85580 [Actinoplanes derwentensis]
MDAKDFTKLPGSVHEETSAAIKTVVGNAMRDAGLEEDWSAPYFFGDTGDGFAAGLPTRILPSLIDPFPMLLQERLAKFRDDRPGEEPLRLRVSLHVGPLPVDPAASSSTGNGTARNDTHRLLDADVIKGALRDVSPEIALVAMIISDRVYDDVVRGRYAGLHPDHFVPVTARVTGKTLDQFSVPCRRCSPWYRVTRRTQPSHCTTTVRWPGASAPTGRDSSPPGSRRRLIMRPPSGRSPRRSGRRTSSRTASSPGSGGRSVYSWPVSPS